MAANPATTEIAMSVRLSARAKEKLMQQAAQHGRDLESYASELLEQAATRPSVDELLAPFRKQVAQSGMTDDELDALYREELSAVREEKKAKSA